MTVSFLHLGANCQLVNRNTTRLKRQPSFALAARRNFLDQGLRFPEPQRQLHRFYILKSRSSPQTH